MSSSLPSVLAPQSVSGLLVMTTVIMLMTPVVGAIWLPDDVQPMTPQTDVVVTPDATRQLAVGASHDDPLPGREGSGVGGEDDDGADDYTDDDKWAEEGRSLGPSEIIQFEEDDYLPGEEDIQQEWKGRAEMERSYEPDAVEYEDAGEEDDRLYFDAGADTVEASAVETEPSVSTPTEQRFVGESSLSHSFRKLEDEPITKTDSTKEDRVMPPGSSPAGTTVSGPKGTTTTGISEEKDAPINSVPSTAAAAYMASSKAPLPEVIQRNSNQFSPVRFHAVGSASDNDSSHGAYDGADSPVASIVAGGSDVGPSTASVTTPTTTIVTSTAFAISSTASSSRTSSTPTTAAAVPAVADSSDQPDEETDPLPPSSPAPPPACLQQCQAALADLDLQVGSARLLVHQGTNVTVQCRLEAPSGGPQTQLSWRFTAENGNESCQLRPGEAEEDRCPGFNDATEEEFANQTVVVSSLKVPQAGVSASGEYACAATILCCEDTAHEQSITRHVATLVTVYTKPRYGAHLAAASVVCLCLLIGIGVTAFLQRRRRRKKRISGPGNVHYEPVRLLHLPQAEVDVAVDDDEDDEFDDGDEAASLGARQSSVRVNPLAEVPLTPPEAPLPPPPEVTSPARDSQFEFPRPPSDVLKRMSSNVGFD